MKKPRRPIRTDHQKEIMGILLREVGEGREPSAAEIYPLLSYKDEVTFGAVRKTIETLEAGGFLRKERRGRNVVLVPTLKGYDWFRPAWQRPAGT